jgi:hypothetical protein
MIRTKCPDCHTRYKFRPGLSGSFVRCPACNYKFQVTGEPEEQSAVKSDPDLHLSTETAMQPSGSTPQISKPRRAKTKCLHCNTQYKFNPEFRGQEFQCKVCSNAFIMQELQVERPEGGMNVADSESVSHLNRRKPVQLSLDDVVEDEEEINEIDHHPPHHPRDFDQTQPFHKADDDEDDEPDDDMADSVSNRPLESTRPNRPVRRVAPIRSSRHSSHKSGDLSSFQNYLVGLGVFLVCLVGFVVARETGMLDFVIAMRERRIAIQNYDGRVSSDGTGYKNYREAIVILIQSYDEAANVLATVKDAETAKAANPSLVRLLRDQLLELQHAQSSFGGISSNENKMLVNEFQMQLRTTVNRLITEINRVKQNPEIVEVIAIRDWSIVNDLKKVADDFKIR